MSLGKSHHSLCPGSCSAHHSGPGLHGALCRGAMCDGAGEGCHDSLWRLCPSGVVAGAGLTGPPTRGMGKASRRRGHGASHPHPQSEK